MKLIEVNNLKFSYDNKVNVINDISFDIESGKYISIIGHNGSGKSTIAKLLLGLLQPNEHSIKEFGLELNHKTIREIRKHVGIVFQNPDNQFVGSTVRDDLAFGLENHQVPHNEMEEIIQKYAAKVNMLDYLDKAPENLSGGQKQRVAIAGVLAMSPDVVIFDEATAMLDPKGKREVKETIDLMRKENPSLTIISITHDVEEASQSDEVIVLNKGSIYLKGSPKEVFSNESLSEIGLDYPFIYKLKKLLKLKGIDVSKETTLEGIGKEICR